MLELPIGLDEYGDVIYLPVNDKPLTIEFTSSSKMGMNMYIHLINNRIATKDAHNN